MTPFFYGKEEATYDRRDVQFAALRTSLSLPTTPRTFGHGNDFPGLTWKMLGNGPDNTVLPGFGGCGCCAWAGPAHETMELCKNAGRKVPNFTGLVVVDQYGEYSGYDPVTGANDTGSNVRAVLQWRATKGLRDADGGVHKVGVYVALEPGNVQHIIEAAFLFEAVGIGIQVPAVAEQQFAEDKPWSVVHGAGSQIVGGHYVPIVGRPQEGLFEVVTWARKQPMTDAFFARYCDEAWAYVSVERLNAVTGKTTEGFDGEALEQYLHALAG